MPMQKDEGGRVTLVVFKATWKQLCDMAGVDESRQNIDGQLVDLDRVDRGLINVQAIHVVDQPEPVFWVCATMLLGNADAMMLASIRREDFGLIWFDGLEVI